MDANLAYGKAGAYHSVAAWGSVADESPHKLVIRLYDGALERIAAARGCMEHGRLADKSALVTRALAIVGELRGSLDLVRGGTVAAHLDDLYDYVTRRLVAANASNRVEHLDEVSALLRELRAAWAAIAPDGRANPR